MTTRISNGALNLLLFSVALGLHFTVVDFGMHKRTPWLYNHWGRWILSVAVAAGWLIGSLVSISQILLGILVAFISGE